MQPQPPAVQTMPALHIHSQPACGLCRIAISNRIIGRPTARFQCKPPRALRARPTWTDTAAIKMRLRRRGVLWNAASSITAAAGLHIDAHASSSARPPFLSSTRSPSTSQCFWADPSKAILESGRSSDARMLHARPRPGPVAGPRKHRVMRREVCADTPTGRRGYFEAEAPCSHPSQGCRHHGDGRRLATAQAARPHARQSHGKLQARGGAVRTRPRGSRHAESPAGDCNAACEHALPAARQASCSPGQRKGGGAGAIRAQDGGRGRGPGEGRARCGAAARRAQKGKKRGGATRC